MAFNLEIITGLHKKYYRFLVRWPWLVIVIVVSMVVVTSIVGLTVYPPSYLRECLSDPSMGVEARGTEISGKSAALRNLDKAIGVDLNYVPNITILGPPGQPIVGLHNQTCAENDIASSHAKFVFAGLTKQNLLNVDDMKSICDLEQSVITDFFNPVCPSHSLPFYIAANHDKNCQDIEQDDIDDFLSLLQDCFVHYETEQLLPNCNIVDCRRIPPKCYKNNAVYKSFHFLLDVDFRATLEDPERILQTTMMLLQNSYPKSTIKQFYKTKVEDEDLESGNIEIAAMEIGYTFDLFLDYLLSDLYLFALALTLIGILMYLYLGSGILVFATFMNVIFSFWVGYFVYHIVFQFDFFGFTNIVTLLLLIAIGADDVFIFADSWEEAKARKLINSDNNSSVNDKQIITQNDELSKTQRNDEHQISMDDGNPGALKGDTLPRNNETDLQDHVTSNNDLKVNETASVYGSKLFEDETPSTSHATDLTDTDSKSAVSASDLEYLVNETFHHASKSILITSFTTGAAMFANFASSITVIRCFGIFTMTCILVNFILMVTWVPCLMVLRERSEQNCCKRCTCNTWNKVKTNVSHGIRKFYGKLLPYFITECIYVLIIIFTLGGIAGTIVVFVTPKFQLPSTTYFPMFVGDHPFEVYYRDMKQRFEFSNPLLSSGNGMDLYFTWGVTPVDNGNWLNPFSRGHLVLEPFDYSSSESQEWLVRFCESLKNESFIAESMRDIECSYSVHWEVLEGECLYPPLNSSISPCCQSHTPVDGSLFSHCLPYCILINGFESGLTIGNHIFDMDNNVKAFVMKVSSNRPFSAVFNDMKDFYHELDAYTKAALKSAPSGLERGWFYSLFDFYDLQANLVQGTYISLLLSMAIALFFLFITTWNGWISAYAIIVIFFCIQVVIACLVAQGWELNVVESAIVTLAVGLSIDFTIHYGVAYIQSEESSRAGKVHESLVRVGSSVSMAAFTTFVAGLSLMPSRLIAYRQFGSFLMIVVLMSWLYATFLLLPVCQLIGPPVCRKSEEDEPEVNAFYDAYKNDAELDFEELPPEIPIQLANGTTHETTNGIFTDTDADDACNADTGISGSSVVTFQTNGTIPNTVQVAVICGGKEGTNSEDPDQTYIVHDENYCTPL